MNKVVWLGGLTVKNRECELIESNHPFFLFQFERNLMKTIVFAVCCLLVTTSDCLAGPFRRAVRNGTIASQRVTGSTKLTAAYGNPAKLQIAIQSATYRAQHGIIGHSHYDSGRRSGIGHSWAKGQTPNQTPSTCLGYGDPNSAYASVCIGNQCFSTVID